MSREPKTPRSKVSALRRLYGPGRPQVDLSDEREILRALVFSTLVLHGGLDREEAAAIAFDAEKAIALAIDLADELREDIKPGRPRQGGPLLLNALVEEAMLPEDPSERAAVERQRAQQRAEFGQDLASMSTVRLGQFLEAERGRWRERPSAAEIARRLHARGQTGVVSVRTVTARVSALWNDERQARIDQLASELERVEGYWRDAKQEGHVEAARDLGARRELLVSELDRLRADQTRRDERAERGRQEAQRHNLLAGRKPKR